MLHVTAGVGGSKGQVDLDADGHALSGALHEVFATMDTEYAPHAWPHALPHAPPPKTALPLHVIYPPDRVGLGVDGAAQEGGCRLPCVRAGDEVALSCRAHVCVGPCARRSTLALHAHAYPACVSTNNTAAPARGQGEGAGREGRARSTGGGRGS